MQEKELDGIIINNLKNVYYLTGFWGSNGTVFISRDRQILVTDARYIIAATLPHIFYLFVFIFL